jgi:hypothetical protein
MKNIVILLLSLLSFVSCQKEISQKTDDLAPVKAKPTVGMKLIVNTPTNSTTELSVNVNGGNRATLYGISDSTVFNFNYLDTVQVLASNIGGSFRNPTITIYAIYPSGVEDVMDNQIVTVSQSYSYTFIAGLTYKNYRVVLEE